MRPHQNTIFCTRNDFNRPYQSAQIEGEKIKVGLWLGDMKPGYTFTLSRSDARLFAKRINQCLDATRKS